MIHYHGTPIGGTSQGAIEFLLGRHALVSHAHPKQIGAVAEACQSFVLDNGAFSCWKKGESVDFSKYNAWVREWCQHPGFDWALIPDDIDGGEGENDALLSAWLDTPLAGYGVAVWHYHESFDRLERIIDLASKRKTAPIIALGSSGLWPSPGTKSWWDRTAEVMRVLCDEHGRPKVKIHGLRMLNPKIFSRLPLASADSTNAGRNQGQKPRFGMYVPPTSGQRAAVIARRIESVNSSPCWGGLPSEFEDEAPIWL